MEKNIKKVTSVELRNLSEGMRLSYTYSVLDESGKIIDSNIKGSFVVLDDMAVEINGESKSVTEAVNVLFKAASDKIK